jgi:hypothetical protein
MILWFLEPVSEQLSMTMSIKYKYVCSMNIQNFVNAAPWKEKKIILC